MTQRSGALCPADADSEGLFPLPDLVGSPHPRPRGKMLGTGRLSAPLSLGYPVLGEPRRRHPSSCQAFPSFPLVLGSWGLSSDPQHLVFILKQFYCTVSSGRRAVSPGSTGGWVPILLARVCSNSFLPGLQPSFSSLQNHDPQITYVTAQLLDLGW